MNMPLVSIIMNCYNCDKFLKDSVDSVMSQSYGNWEIIFWDNASVDSSASIIKSYRDPRIRYYSSEVTTPLGYARNKALKKVKGDYVAFLDCDDLFLMDKLLLQVSLMNETGCAMCYGGAALIEEDGALIRERSPKNKTGMIFCYLLKNYEINMQSVMVRRSVLSDNHIEFDELLSYSPDFNMFMRIAAQHDVAVIKKMLVKHRVCDNSLSTITRDLASKEGIYTLDVIRYQYPNLYSKYTKEFDLAYAKFIFYDSIYCLYQDDRVGCRMILRKILHKRFVYLLLFLISYLPISNKTLLRIMRR